MLMDAEGDGSILMVTGNGIIIQTIQRMPWHRLASAQLISDTKMPLGLFSK